MASNQFKKGNQQSNVNLLHSILKNQYAIAGFLVAALALMVIAYLSEVPNNSVQESDLTSFEVNVEDSAKPFEGTQFEIPQIFQPAKWGTLNSGHYFGMKLSTPNSIETSLIWFQNKLNRNGKLSMRHLCDQNDGLVSYSWVKHDFHNFGMQVIEDTPFNIDTSFVKNPQNKLEWQAKISVSPTNFSYKSQPYISFIQYVLLNSDRDLLDIVSSKSVIAENSLDTHVNLFQAQGMTEETGNFRFNIDLNSSKNFIYGNYYRGIYDKKAMPISTYLHTKMLSTKLNDTRLFVLPGNLKVPSYYARDNEDKHVDKPNFLAYQLILKIPVKFSVTFTQSSSIETPPTDYEDLLAKNSDIFDEKFDKIFQIPMRDKRPDLVELGKVALSNMLGGIGYFYGRAFINSHANPNKIVPYGPVQLLTAVPSRSFFPRGFLWDEGFHNILISEWDADISNKIIESWFNIENKNGWIPREVILGIESMRRVPEEFIVQHISDGNPPSMFLAIEKMIEDKSLSDSTLKKIYPRLLAWYNWFNSTQSGPKPLTFRWRGRDELSVNMLNPKTLTSGLDDYPRASHPSKQEYHIDLLCWMALTTRTLAKIANTVGDSSTEERMLYMIDKLHDNEILDQLHWSEKDQLYCDYGHSTERSELVKVTKTRTKPDGKVEAYQAFERHSYGKLNFGCVPEFGYVSLFPFMMSMIKPDNPKLGVILDRLQDELWSLCGVRSLSKKSKYYNKYNTEHDKPYWRGAVWMNMNYLILKSLRYYSRIEGPHRSKCDELFHELKHNLIDNVFSQFKKTGYIWESYDDQSCRGKGSHPFTGWTSLILLIMSGKI